jgi:hypothetical protein
MAATKTSRRPNKAAARKRAARPDKLSAPLAEAAWTEADAALAEALAELEAFENAKGRAARADALALLGQALSRAARKRGLSRFGKVGAREPFDQRRHALALPAARPPKTVRIVAQGIARGGEVLVKARAVGVRAKRT